MKRNTSCHERLLHYLDRNEDYSSMMDWIGKQPLLDQPDILRELTAILKERHEKTGEKNWLEKAIMIEEGIDQFEDEILEEKLADNLLITEISALQLSNEEIRLFMEYARELVINKILSETEINKELWNLAHMIITAEKKSGIYDHDNWKAIL